MKGIFPSLLAIAAVAASGADAAGQTWYEHRSEHFIVLTDVSGEDAMSLLTGFEKHRRVAQTFAGIDVGTIEVPMRVVMFNDVAEYDALGTRMPYAGAISESLDPRAPAETFSLTVNDGHITVIGPSVRRIFGLESHISREGADGSFRHAYVHHLVRELGRLDYPRWYEEGLAEVLEHTDYNGKEIRVGESAYQSPTVAYEHTPTPVRSLIAPDMTSDPGALFTDRYALTLWYLVHLFEIGTFDRDEQYRSQTRDFLDRYGVGEDPISAFEASYGITPEEMTGVLRLYSRRSSIPIIELPNESLDVEITSRPLDASEQAYLLADIALRMGQSAVALDYLASADGVGLKNRSLLCVAQTKIGDTEGGEKCIEDSLTDEDANSVVLSNLGLAVLERSQDVSNIDLVAELAGEAIRIDPSNIDAHVLLWRVHDARGEFAEGARSMMYAYRLDESNVGLNIQIADFLVRNGRHDLARPFVERAWNWTHLMANSEWASRLLDEIEKATR